jgi:hypothetical protein
VRLAHRDRVRSSGTPLRNWQEGSIEAFSGEPHVSRRTAKGETTKEMERGLKRYVARHLFSELEALPANRVTRRGTVPLAATKF